MNQPLTPPTEEIAPPDAELVAYLDGELEPDHARRIEQRLASDERCRERLRQLQRSWDLLDSLPRAEASSTFTRSTIEMVAQQVEVDVNKAISRSHFHQRLAWIFGVVGVTLAALIGFFAGRVIWRSPDDELLRDLPVIEKVDVYLQAGNIEFLRMLESEQLFTEEPNHGQ